MIGENEYVNDIDLGGLVLIIEQSVDTFTAES